MLEIPRFATSSQRPENCTKRLVISIEAIIVIAIFLAFPLYATPFIFKGIMERKKWAIVLGIILVGFLGILYPPYGDIYRYTDDFATIKNLDWDEFKLFLLLKQDVFLPILSYIFGRIGLYAEHTRFVFVAISYLLYFLMFYYETKGSNTIKDRLYCYILIVPLMFSGTLFRFGFATAFFSFGVYLYLLIKDIRGLIFLAFAVLIHFTFFPLVILVLICQKQLFNLSYKYFSMLCILLLFSNWIPIAENLIHLFLPAEYLNHYDSYISGGESADITTGYSSSQLLVFVYRRFSLILAMLLCCFYYKRNKEPSRIKCFLNLLILLLIASGSIPILFNRFLNVFNTIIIITIAHHRKDINQPLLLQLVVWSIILSAIFSFWQFRFVVLFSQFDAFVNSNFYDLFTFEYDERWINANVDSEGTLIRWLEAGYEPGR